MPQYDVHALCSECGKFHDLLVRIMVNGEFDVYTLDDAYKDGQISSLVLPGVDRLTCPNTLKSVPLPSPDKLVLVAVKQPGNRAA